MPKTKASDATERAYTRGVHQALYWAFVRIEHCRTIDEARALLGRATDAAQAVRENRQPVLFGTGLLDVIDETLGGA